MTEYTATRDFELTDGKHCFARGDVRYTFTVTPGRPAKTWAILDGQFSPEERGDVDVTQIEWRWGGRGAWIVADSQLFDMLAEVSKLWFLEQAREQDE